MGKGNLVHQVMDAVLITVPLHGFGIPTSTTSCFHNNYILTSNSDATTYSNDNATSDKARGYIRGGYHSHYNG